MTYVFEKPFGGKRKKKVRPATTPVVQNHGGEGWHGLNTAAFTVDRWAADEGDHRAVVFSAYDI